MMLQTMPSESRTKLIRFATPAFSLKVPNSRATVPWGQKSERTGKVKPCSSDHFFRTGTAWQVMMAPIDDDDAEVRRELLKSVTNPAPAATVEGLEKALEDWETTKRLFTEADGVQQGGDHEAGFRGHVVP